MLLGALDPDDDDPSLLAEHLKTFHDLLKTYQAESLGTADKRTLWRQYLEYTGTPSDIADAFPYPCAPAAPIGLGNGMA